MISHIDICYFSGTGNTLILLNEFLEVLKANNIMYTLHKIEKIDSSTINIIDTIAFVFPVAMQGTYPFIWDFIESLPDVHGRKIKAFMFDSLAMFSGGIVGPVKRILRGKGYITIGAKEFIMPSNLLRKNLNANKIKKRIIKTKTAVRRFAKDLINGNTKWHSIPILSYLMSLISRSKYPWRLFRKLYPILTNNEKCTRCGLCEKLCPVSNIELKEIPIHGQECVFCMRCFSFCPTQAISIGKKKNILQYRALSANDLLK